MFSCCKLQMFYLNVVYILHTCCKYMSQLFHLLRCMLLSSLSCCKCLCFRGMFRESWGHGLDAGEGARRAKGRRMARTASRGPADGARGMPRVRRTGRARSHPGSRVPPEWRERRGLGGSCDERRAGRDGRGRVRGGMRQTEKECCDTVGVWCVSS